MNPFTVTCTTCQTSLKVADRSAVGQIHPCPKCGSMVLISPPHGNQPGDPSAPTSRGAKSAATESSAVVSGHSLDDLFEEAASLVSDEPPVTSSSPTPAKTVPETAPASPQPSTASTQPPAEAPTSPAEETPPEPISKTTPTAESTSTDAPTGAAATPPPPPPKPSAKMDSAIQQASETTAPEATAPAATPAPPPPPPQRPADLNPSGDWASPAAQNQRRYLMIGRASVATILLIAATWGFIASRQSNVTSESPNTQITEDTAQEDDAPADEPAASDERPEAEDPPVTDTDPDTVADETPPSTADDIPTVESPTATQEDVPAPPDPSDLAVDPDDPFAEPEAAADVSIDPDQPHPLSRFTLPSEIPLEDLPADPTGGREEPAIVDVKNQLAGDCPGMEFEQIALIDFLRFTSELTATPITLDPDAVLHAGIHPRHSISVRVEGQTVAEMLSAVLAPLGLTHIASDGHVLVVKARLDGKQPRSGRYQVDDLGGDTPKQLAALAEMVKRCVVPGNWKETGGAGGIRLSHQALMIEQSESAHFNALLLFEKLRVARGLAARSSYPEEYFELATRTERASEALATPLTVTYNRPKSLTAIVAKLTQLTGVAIVVDWRELAAANWSPATAAGTLIAVDDPLGDALDELLQPMDLTYRVIDARTIQITTPVALHQNPELELHEVDDLIDREVSGALLIEAIKRNLFAAHADRPGTGPAIHFDTKSQTLVTWLPQAQQRRLTALLAAWRSEGE